MFKFLIVLLFQIPCACAADGGSTYSALLDSLAVSGHRYLETSTIGDTLVIRYWPVGFRDEYGAFRNIRTVTTQWFALHTDSKIDHVIFIQEAWGIPLIRSMLTLSDSSAIDVGRDLLVQRESVSYASNSFPGILLQFDFPLKANFGEPFDPLVFRTGIRSDLRVMILPGFLAYGQMEFYVHNEYDPKQWYEPANIGFMYARPFSGTTLSVTNIGLFQRELYGIDEEIRTLLFDETISVGFRGGVFGKQRFRNSRFEYYPLNKWMSILNVAWTWTRYDCTFGVKGGRFLYGDRGVGVEISRIFKEVEIGLSGVRSGPDVITYMNFRIPLYPPSRKERASHGIGLVNAFRMSYRNDSRGLEPRDKPFTRAYEPESGISYRELEGLARVPHFRFMFQEGR